MEVDVVEALNDWIKNELPYEGEWSDESNMQKYINCSHKLFLVGIKPPQIKELLSELYSAVLNEFI